MKSLKKVLCILFALLSLSVSAQEIFSEIQLNNPTDISQLAAEGFTVDHPNIDENNNIKLLFSETELQRLNQLGIQYTVTIQNYKNHYLQQRVQDQQNQIIRNSNVAEGFDLGSMGGFYTFDEVVAKLDEMKTDFPNLITAKTSIGTTIEGRDIWMVKISDNPEIDEPEPAAYFDALHHAREPLSMATSINFMFYLLENYNSDLEVQYLVNNRELYFVPVVNPDGYVYNETTDPNGGGLWRKNRNVDAGGCVGVDLNRNYGFGFNNNADCSSGDPCSGVYRGTGPFSELETQAVSNLLSQIQPKTAFSTHSTAGTYLMPYGYDTSPPDFEIYSEWASAFLDENDYTYGVTFQILNYTSCGTTRDYLHSEGIYGWTPEIDGSGFWPMPSTIFALVGENVRPMFYQSFISGPYLDVQSHTQLDDAIPGETMELLVELKNVGLENTSGNVNVQLSIDSQLISSQSSIDYGIINARARKENTATPFLIEISPAFDQQFFNVEIIPFQDGVRNESITIPIFIGERTTLFNDTSENGAANWISSGNNLQWGVTNDDSYSGTTCFTDSAGGNQLNNTLNFFELNQSFDFSTTTGPLLSFMAKFALAAGDFTSLETSIDGGTNWEVFEIYTANESWNMKNYSLAQFNGQSDVRFRFKMQSNESIPGDGFYFDDFNITDYEEEILNISEIYSEFNISALPNPFINQITISTSETSNFEITLFDMQGRKVSETLKTKNGTIEIKNLDTLTIGIYFATVVTEAGPSTSLKLIKK
ncbi:MAG: M14 family zinc carboxypeptidase [Patiriisocius sp.]|uniref:M14 family zinc carboxypeptidase n=1 Tax=Patiriisocius sp. TaxID=2822396 RepID=UPI003EF69C5A